METRQTPWGSCAFSGPWATREPWSATQARRDRVARYVVDAGREPEAGHRACATSRASLSERLNSRVAAPKDRRRQTKLEVSARISS